MEARLKLTEGPLTPIQEEMAIHLTKECFERRLSLHLNLTRISAPLFVEKNSGVQDNLNGTEAPISFKAKSIPAREFEIVHSLAKWKRFALKHYQFKTGEGLVTDMKAIRPDEESLSDLHSIYVDQWDWEKILTKEQRALPYLKEQVQLIYKALLETEIVVTDSYSHLSRFLPKQITFIHTEDLEGLFPALSPKEREDKIVERYGAVFLIGIGGDLPISGLPHDGRAPDYDDWSTPTEEGKKGINGDILIWSPILQRSIEISSMGIRVDEKALEKQLQLKNETARKEQLWHQMLLKGELPYTIGGGIGQSRLTMLLLQKRHIGETQVSSWNIPAQY